MSKEKKESDDVASNEEEITLKAAGSKRPAPEDDAEDEGKLTARREANRMHALKSRQRSKNLLHELQQTVHQLSNEKGELERQNAVLRAQVEVLQQQNRALLQSQQHFMMIPSSTNNPTQLQGIASNQMVPMSGFAFNPYMQTLGLQNLQAPPPTQLQQPAPAVQQSAAPTSGLEGLVAPAAQGQAGPAPPPAVAGVNPTNMAGGVNFAHFFNSQGATAGDANQQLLMQQQQQQLLLQLQQQQQHYLMRSQHAPLPNPVAAPNVASNNTNNGGNGGNDAHGFSNSMPV